MKRSGMTIFLLLSLLCVKMIIAEAAESGDYTYTILDDGTAEITGYSGSETALIIPDNLDGHAVSSIGAHAFYDHQNISSIKLPNTVTKLGDYAFMNCNGLSDIELPDGIAEVGGNPFGNCDIHFTVSQNHPYLAVVDGALIGTSDKRILYVPVNAKSFTIPDDIETIGNGAFYCCSDIEGIEIPNSVTSIDPYAFYKCSGLTTVIMPDSVKSIGDYAFFGCTGLHEIRIPTSVENMGNNPFCACDTNIILSGEHSYLHMIDSVLFSNPDGRLIYCPTSMDSYIVPDGTISISGYAFYDCEKLTSVQLPDSIVEIGAYAFTNCDNLEVLINQNAYAVQYCQDNDIKYDSKQSVTEAKSENTIDNQEEWVCPECGNATTDNFCNICGTKKALSEWICQNCGQEASGKFCSICGAPKPEDGSPSAETIDSVEAETDKTPDENVQETTDSVITEAVPVETVNEEGIHRYEYCIEDCTWNQAFQKAKDKGGYLVHINSKEEYEFLLSEIAQQNLNDKKFYIGGKRNLDSTEYYWVDENGITYGDALNSPEYWGIMEWLPGEPTYKDGDTVEAYMDIFFYSDIGIWVWNDIPDDVLAIAPYYSGTIGFIVEYNS